MFNPMMGGGQQQDMGSAPMNANRGMASGRNPGNHFGMGGGMGMGGRIGNKIAGRASAMSSRNIPPTGNFGSTPPFSVGPEMKQPTIGPDRNFMQNAMGGAVGAAGRMRNQDNRTIGEGQQQTYTERPNRPTKMGGENGGMGMHAIPSDQYLDRQQQFRNMFSGMGGSGIGYGGNTGIGGGMIPRSFGPAPEMLSRYFGQ